MSEPILKALMQLFVLISDVHSNREISSREKDIVRLFLSRQLNSELVRRYMDMFDEYMLLYCSDNIIKGSIKARKRTSLTAMRILAICEKINEELHQKQKLYVIVQLIDYILFGAEITENELDFLETVSDAFNIPQQEYMNIKSFILSSVNDIPEKKRVMIIDNAIDPDIEGVKHLYKENLKGRIFLLYILSANTYILRYSGKEDLFLNGQNIFPEQTYIFDHGSTIRSSGINTLYYYDINAVFTQETFKLKISLDATDLCLRFKDSENGIHNLNFHEKSGKLVGILGGSGVGKSTLLNVLSGITEPQSGEVLINGYNLYSEKENDYLKGVIGFVPQDDLLIEELTVFQNLYFNARMCLDNLPENRLLEVVEKTLVDLDLDETRNLKVGNPLNKVISGGQRKRLNIALELIREPNILFVDEPTSGLSSVDSEIVMNLLKEQTYRGRLVIINIHQPASDLYKMFDKIMIIDKGGYQIFYGNPTEAIIYFKRKASLANANEDQCITCGNVNSDQLLQIIEAKVVNENGKPTHIRKITPKEWADRFSEDADKIKQKSSPGDQAIPENHYCIPGLLKQTKIFFIRDLLSKLANRQYIIISLLGSPLLAFLLAYFTKYVAGEKYLLSENENLPAYIFMCVITALFLGLIISAEEIIRDRKVLKRESFLNLSWFSYLNSKIAIMFLISAIQTISFILIGNFILEIKGLNLSYWIVLFSTSCYANMLGLNISSAFNSVITIYILIPFILIPQLLFSGVLVKFDRLHKSNITSYEYVPVIGDMMAARWSFEALAVEQFKNNRYEKNFFRYDMEISQNEWYASYLLIDLKQDLKECQIYKDSTQYREVVIDDFAKLNYHIDKLKGFAGLRFIPGKWKASLNIDRFSSEVAEQTKEYLDSLTGRFRVLRNNAMEQRDSVAKSLEAEIGIEELINLKDNFENRKLKELVLEWATIHKSIKTPKKIIQKYEPGYMKPVSKYGRAQLFTPYKRIGNISIDTFWFNILVLWVVTFILYLTLYYNLFQRTINFFFFIRDNFRKSSNNI
ncbi:MAG: ATP-binding cassette domain-containing protein [Bacteroidales bacterium]|nr:ATP-binding cassette domain-containing protein [Bacteroidales bacterium]